MPTSRRPAGAVTPSPWPRGPSGGWALSLQISWDAPAQADEFEATYGSQVDGLPFAARIIRLSDRETLVLQASSGPVLDAAAAVSNP